MDLTQLRAEMEALAAAVEKHEYDAREYEPGHELRYEDGPSYAIDRTLERLEQLRTNVLATLPDRAERVGTWIDEEKNKVLAAQRAIDQRYESFDRERFDELRARIRAGSYTAADFRRDAEAFTPIRPHLMVPALERFVEGLFGILRHPRHTFTVGESRSIYQATATTEAICLFEALALTSDDVFFDIGSGLGKAVILTAWLTPATAIGIELEREHADISKRAIAELTLPRAQIIHGDAFTQDYSKGTVFYFFNPFHGEMPAPIMTQLESVAEQHGIRICTGWIREDNIARTWLTKEREVGAISIWKSVKVEV